MASTNIDERVILEQTLLRVPETFIYKIPPMATSCGFHAEDWNLANPIATCSLHVKRVDSALFIELFTDRPKPNAPPGATEKHLFARSKVCLNLVSEKPTFKMDYYVEAVTDSSRYFAIRISDEKSGREARVGLGFRERNDALNFKMSLQDYERAMEKEAMLSKSSTSDVAGDDGGEIKMIELPMSKLTLKDGEKIHLNINVPGKTKRKLKTTVNSASRPMLLKKPPPPASMNAAETEKSDSDEKVILADDIIKNDDSDENDTDWGDFESS